MNIYKNIFGIEFNWKNAMLLIFLAALPNVVGLFHTTIFGIRIHFFQYLIFLAAMIYGPAGGAMAGAFGSIHTAIALHNPYIVIGNIILGVFVGLFYKRINIVLAVLLAYAIQLPWLWMTDIYLAGMPVNVVNGVVLGLLVSNTIMAFIAWGTAKKIKQLVM